MRVAYTTDGEPWTVYKLADGTEVKVKTLLLAVNRREGEFQPDGNPVYDLNFQNIVGVDAPDHLKLKPTVSQAGNV